MSEQIRRCTECHGIYEATIDGLHEHIYQSKEHNEYLDKKIKAEIESRPKFNYLTLMTPLFLLGFGITILILGVLK
jgi:hypothetical protein